MKNMPIYKVKKVWHVGLMDKSLKQRGSLEGSGLSVSECPMVWEEIAEIGGNYFELTKDNGRFLDFHELSKSQRDEIIQWGIHNGFIELGILYKYVLYDEEGEEMYGLCDTYIEALEEVDGDEEMVFVVSNSVIPTSKLVKRVMGDSLVNAFDVLSTVYVEDVLSLDGVWFHDELDRYALSAPRGVIVPRQLDSWITREIEETEVPIQGSRYEESF